MLQTAIGAIAIKNSENIFSHCDVFTSTKMKMVQAKVFPLTVHVAESLTLKKQVRKSIDAFEFWF